MARRRKILVAPIDWGLGHATRCIPIIRQLLKKNCEVLIASSGRSLSLLRKEFPQVDMFRLTAYDPEYPTGDGMVGKMATQAPKFLRTVGKEKGEIEKIVDAHKPEIIISDNRFGCYHKDVRSIFITHQLNILMPDAWKWMEGPVNWYNHRYIARFNQVWVPAPQQSPLAFMAENKNGFNARYIGYLSRMEKKSLPNRFRICVVCSGPEPQRTIFADLFTEQLKGREYNTIIVKGETEKLNPFFNKDQQHMIANYLTSNDLNEALEESEIIIARPGYSTVMDLAKLGKKAIFIPTPGQTEQQFLAKQLMQQGLALSVDQTAFDLDVALKESEKFAGFANFTYDESALEAAIDSIL